MADPLKLVMELWAKLRGGTAIEPLEQTGGNLHVAVDALPLPTGAATETTLAAVRGQLDITQSALRDALRGGGSKTLTDLWNSLQTQREISTSLWTDDSGAKYVRRDVVDESTGTITVSFTDANGNPATPGVGLRPLASTDKETVESLFTATAGGTGYVAGDILARVLVIDTSVSPPGVSATWMNVSDGTIIAAPTAGTMDAFVGLTDAELALRLNTLGQKTAALSAPFTLPSDAERDNRFASLLKYEAKLGEKLRRKKGVANAEASGEWVGLTSDYHLRAPLGTATSATTWEAVRFYKSALLEVVQTSYLATGVSADAPQSAAWVD